MMFPYTAFMRIAIGDAIVRQSSLTEPGGYVYFKRSNGKAIGTKTGRLLIETEALTPVGDGLFEGQSQCFEKTRADPPEKFRRRRKGKEHELV